MFSAQEPKELWKEKKLAKKAVLKSYATFPGKHLCWSLPEGLQLY